MDQNLIYAKTPIGDEAVRQSTRVVQRNLRMVLVQVDGKLTVGELGAKIGNPKLVEGAIRELEQEGYIAPILEAASIWEQSKKAVSDLGSGVSSKFSTFGPKSIIPDMQVVNSRASEFSSFGKPILPSRAAESVEEPAKGAKKEKTDRREREEAHPEDALLRRRKMVRYGVMGALGLLVAAFLGIVFFPYNEFKPRVEGALTRALGMPVKVGQLSLSLLPRPMLTLQGVKLGDRGETSIAEIGVPSALSLMKSGRTPLSRVMVRGVSISVDQLGALQGIAEGLGAAASPVQLSVVEVEKLAASIGGVAVGTFTGEINFAGDGRLEKIQLASEDRSLSLQGVPTREGTALQIEGFGWKVFGSETYVFESMAAKGLLKPGKLLVQDIDTTFMGGILKGNWLVDWSNGWSMAGDATAARLNTRRLLDTLGAKLKVDGELSGGFRMRGMGSSWGAMWEHREASLDGEINRGMVTGIDLGEAARRGTGFVVRSGFTKFDRMTGRLVFSGNKVQVSDIALDAGLLRVSGKAGVANGQLDGLFDVSIQSSGSGLRLPVRVSGPLNELQAVAGR